ncbi:Rieske (2Fe-2S) protein [Pandoraea anapnoica]|uniref:Rieske (2Fe-2S) protein n=1 Tax=Pandoraea anapnoica TaxID=2508301 RepID=A0A5E4ZMA4_9BURK|nr:Rieske (2Fe-2S) protein [Pandoraea anapnoica]VVE62531.1 Rieske (2Fe-2S) protein [Pandoraea anapnoica]
MSSPIFLVHLDAMPDPGARGFDPHGVGHDTMFVVRNGTGVRAWRNACPHYGDTPMAWRKDAYLNHDGSRIVCHAHAAQFDLVSGACLAGPCLGQSLTQLALNVNARGEVFLLTCERGVP